MKSASKDLLRLEKEYFSDLGPKHDSKENVITRMLQKPKKPDFSKLPKSEILSKVKGFLPDFKQNTENLLKDEKELTKKRIDDEDQNEKPNSRTFLKKLKPPSEFIFKTGTFQQATQIKMNLLVGVFDVNNKIEEKTDKIIELNANEE